MESERWQRMRKIFLELLERDPDERPAFLNEACRKDPTMRNEIEEMLEASEGIDGFLDPPEIDPDAVSSTDNGLTDTRIGQYLLKRVISSGGMGTVYEARQEQPQRKVAVKIMRAGIVSKSGLRRFEYESEILARLNHPGIAQVFEAGTHAEAGEPTTGMPFFAMEYIENALTITAYAREQELRVRDRLKLFMQALESVHYGHQKGIIHRDLKPANILVDEGGHVKIIDFGVAKATDSDVALTTAHTDMGQLIGTVQYMSPEQCSADPHDLDVRSDVYALGVVLYELLCGKPPYDLKGKPIYEATHVIREEPPERPSTTDRTLKGDAETIVLKALEKDREHRYASAEDLRRDIDRYLKGESIAARPPSAVYQFRIFIRRHKALVGGAAAVFAVLVVGIVVSMYLYFRAVHEAETTQSINSFYKEMLMSLHPSSYYLLDFEPNRSSNILEITDTGKYDENISVAEMLQRSIPRARERFADNPAVAAEILETISHGYYGLGLWKDCLPLIRDALSLRREHFGEDHPDTLLLKLRLIARLIHNGKMTEANELARQAWDGLEQTFGPHHRLTLFCRALLGHIMSYMKQFTESNKILRAVIEDQKRVLDETDNTIVDTKIYFAMSLHMQLRYKEGFPLVQEIFEICRNTMSENHINRVESGLLLGMYYLGRCNYEEAKRVIQPACDISRRIYGEDHAKTLFYHGRLVRALTGKKDQKKREQLFKQLIAGYRDKFDENYANLKGLFKHYAQFLASQGRYDETEALYRDRMERCVKTLSKKLPYRTRASKELAELLLNRHKIEEGMAALTQWLDLQVEDLGKGAPQSIDAIQSAAEILWRIGKTDEARALLTDAINAGRDRVQDQEATADDCNALAWCLLTCYPPDLRDPQASLPLARRAVDLGGKDANHLDTLAEAYNALGDHERALITQQRALDSIPEGNWKVLWKFEDHRMELLLAKGDLEEARRYITDLEIDFHETYGAGERHLCRRMLHKVLALVEAGDYAFAEPLARKCRDYRAKDLFGNGFWEVKLCECMIGRCLAGLGRFEEGEPLLLSGYEGMKGNPIAPLKYQQKALRWIVELYEDQGQEDQAAAWRGSLPEHLWKGEQKGL